MKKLILATCILLGFCSKAEYNGWHFEILIYLESGDSTKAYFYDTSAYSYDSLDNADHVTRFLKSSWRNSQDTLKVFLNRLEYNYKYHIDQEDTAQIYSLFNYQEFPWKSIDSIQILSHLDFSYLLNLESDLTYGDTSWCFKPVDTIVNFGMGMCEYTLTFHELTDEIRQELKRVSDFQKDVYSHPYKYLGISEEDEAFGRELDFFDDETKLGELIQKELKKLFKSKKLVVISFCSC